MFDSMEGAMAATIGWFYLATNAARVFAYLPQITAIWRCHDGAQAISLLTWGMWTVSHVAALLYGALLMHDLYFVTISTVNLTGCGLIAALATWRRMEFERAHARVEDAIAGVAE
ncbi:MAG: hypothetical protein JSS01_14190 [Proteobacteria bacterium]|nr:hypothetical protein [Pseudomonadota bacterium]